MNTIGEVLRFLSALGLGLFAGAQLTEAFVLVSYWNSLAPQEFLSWYAANDRRLLDFFRPLTTVTFLLAVAAALVSTWTAHPGRWLAAVAALIQTVVVAMFFVYFESANQSFAAGTIGADAVPAELGRWATWHWLRTALSLIALSASLLCLRADA